jgi:O-antigen/teichoic acid export membrane protein
MNSQIGKGLLWKLLERFGVQGSQFVLQLVLARILDPDHYGVLSLMVIFTTLANVFIQTGFNTALIRTKDVTEEDYSSVFWVSLGIAGLLYGAIFLCAPMIGGFYQMPDIVAPLRVMALMLFPGALNSVQLAKVSREMDFRKVFFSNLSGILIAGTVGIVIALLGGGLWALVAQTMLNVFVACLVMWGTSGLKLRFVCDLGRVRLLFAFGWKLLVSGLLDTLYQDLRSLVIGKKYNSETLGFYNRGKQFPQFIINAVNGTVQSVMLPAMSAKQDDQSQVKQLTRSSIMISAYILFPLMAGLAGVASALVELLLTEKWLPCVPYMQIYCFTLAFYPVHSCNLQAINAMGRSDIFLKLEIVKKGLGIGALLVAVFCFDSPIAIAMTGAFTTVISCFINAYPNKKLIDYSYFEQMRDILPSIAAAVVMLGAVLAVQLLGLGAFATLAVQIALGVAVYAAVSVIFRLEPFRLLLNMLKNKAK